MPLSSLKTREYGHRKQGTLLLCLFVHKCMYYKILIKSYLNFLTLRYYKILEMYTYMKNHKFNDYTYLLFNTVPL